MAEKTAKGWRVPGLVFEDGTKVDLRVVLDREVPSSGLSVYTHEPGEVQVTLSPEVKPHVLATLDRDMGLAIADLILERRSES